LAKLGGGGPSSAPEGSFSKVDNLVTLCLAFASSFSLAKVSILIIDGIFSNFGVFYDFGGDLLSFSGAFAILRGFFLI
jgi:hypothetical protein